MSESRGDIGKSTVGHKSPERPLSPAFLSATHAVDWKRRFSRNRTSVASAWFLLVIILAILSWPVTLKVASLCGPRAAQFANKYQPEQLSSDQFQAPSARHWFGTDVHGRDLFSRVLYGAQVSLLVGLIGAMVSLVIGVLWGAVAGYAGGRLDSVMMRIVDILYSLPSIIFVIVLI